MAIGVGIGTIFKSSASWSSYWTPSKFVESEFGVQIAFCLLEFANDVWIPINEYFAGNNFNPTDLDIDEWLDASVAMGAKYVQIYTMSHEGFCLWNTDTHVDGQVPYSINQTDWYANNGNYDLVKELVDGCRARGLKPMLYWSIWDAQWERYTGTTHVDNAAGLIAYKKAQITELLTRYGKIYAFWIDGWGWHIPYTEGAGVPYAILYDHIKSLQRDCLVINNDHVHPPLRSEIDVYEEPSEYLPSNNAVPAEVYKTIRTDDTNGFDLLATENVSDFRTALEVNIVRYLSNLYGATFTLNLTPNNTGHLHANQLAALSLLGTPIKSALVIDRFMGTNGTRLNVHTMNIGSGWTENVGTWSITANKAHSATLNNTSILTTDSGQSDVDISLDYVTPNELNYIGILIFRYVDTTHHWRVVVERDAGGTPVIVLNNYSTAVSALIPITHIALARRTIRVKAIGQSITVWWNGIKVIEYATAADNLTAKKHGIGIWRDATYKDILFSNFLVDTP